MTKPISKRCGVGYKCPLFDSANKESGCVAFTDRSHCPRSVNNRKRNARKARKRKQSMWAGY